MCYVMTECDFHHLYDLIYVQPYILEFYDFVVNMVLI